MTFNAGCWMRRLAALAIATSLLSGCAPGISEPRIATVCPPVVQYSREFQARATDELVLLPEGSAIAETLSDYGDAGAGVPLSLIDFASTSSGEVCFLVLRA